MQKITMKKPASKGVVRGEVFLYRPSVLQADKSSISPKATAQELGRFVDGLASARRRIVELAEKSEIFRAHLDIADDPFIHETVAEKITKEYKNAELALEETANQICLALSEVDDEYLRERAADIKDVCTRIMRRLKGVSFEGLNSIDKPVILVASNLTPSDAASLNPNYVLGIITAEGGNTSHVAILARSMEIPAIVGMTGITDIVASGRDLILDAVEGVVILDPDAATIDVYEKKAKDFQERKLALKAISKLKAETTDGHKVSLCANVGNLQDIQSALPHGIDGVGLLRSEFLYMESQGFPSEADQFLAYKTAAQKNKGETIIRTLDIGGDKSLPYYQFEPEENPFLGWRAIRMCLEMVDVFGCQLRAILRASAFGKVKIMYPMMISIEELEEANALLNTAKKELKATGQAFDADIQVGMMIETPAAFVLAKDFAKRVDFFSIGTNDLTQYLLAVDRGNFKVASLYNFLHPAVLRSVKAIIDAGHEAGIPVGMCGEMAGNELAVPLLLGMGLDEFSMTPSQVPEVKFIIRNWSYQEAAELAEKAINASSLTEIMTILESIPKERTKDGPYKLA
ncbi:MAG: phosphoenolpyruvate--protein phosphotransferase [Deltaproteobacteria bacterium]|jgi:phosphotransferase system enzyme I (PtsI)|nr:phosphoenolpyruvate--protein phosphotransferase [Deltaproteobacteria bacterium]